MYVCDVCNKPWIGSHDSPAPRSRCYSCETSEEPWRDRIADEITDKFLGDADLLTAELIARIIEDIRTPGPPAVPNFIRRESSNSNSIVRYVSMSIEDDDDIIEAEIIEVRYGPTETEPEGN